MMQGKRIRRGIFTALMALLMVVPLTFVSATQASAATSCGAGYTRVGSHAIRDWENNGGDSYVGTLEIYWSSGAGRNCAIARCEGSNCGKSLYRDVYIRRYGDLSWNDGDRGKWVTLAGPVWSANSRGRCIDVKASFSSRSSGSQGDKGSVYIEKQYCG